jgi:hypothetical protein
VSRYRKIYVRTWSDEKFRSLSAPQPNGQTLWIYLLTGEHTCKLPGLFRAGEAALAEALDWPLKAFRQAFQEVSAKGMAEADWRARLIFIPKALEHNPPENPNVVKGWASEWDEMPECSLKDHAEVVFKAFLEGLGKAFAEAFQQALEKPRAKRFQEGDPKGFGKSGSLISEHGALSTESPQTPRRSGGLSAKAKRPEPEPEQTPEQIATNLAHLREFTAGIGNGTNGQPPHITAPSSQPPDPVTLKAQEIIAQKRRQREINPGAGEEG